jgi:hypothetical protein
LRSLLDSAGVPHSPAQVGSELRVKCAAAAWAADAGAGALVAAAPNLSTT